MSIKKKLCLLFAFVCTAVLATGVLTLKAEAQTLSGSCGANLTYTLDTDTGTLTIQGKGAMENYDYPVFPPWHNYRLSIKTVKLQGKLTSIGDSAFSDCSSLTSITLPDSVTSIGNKVFSGCSSLTSITIPDGVTSIGGSAFYLCSSLTSITIPEGVTSIGNKVFSGCSSLTSITIPDGVTRIGGSAFHGCSSLTSITIPDGVTSIGYSAFSYCSNLTSITIPDGVTSIGDSAFRGCSNLTSITIPDGVTSIGDSAFYGCSSLTSITIPDSVTSIGSAAFAGCASLECINVDINNTEYISSEGVLYSKDKKILMAYPPKKDSSYYQIPDGVTSIGDSAFSDCSSLTSITIPDGVTSIGYSAFSSCSRLTSITIPDGVTSIGSYVFSRCSSLTSITIPDGVTSIGNDAFSGCSSLTSITIPDGVTSIGYSTFSVCSSLTSITIPDGVTSIGYSAFSYCDSLTSITIPDSVTSINSNAFSGCGRLYVIYNNSNINLTIGSTYHGQIARYARAIVNKDGTITYAKENGVEYYLDNNGFLFKIQDGQYFLIAYAGEDTRAVLPPSADGNAYEVDHMRGAVEVVLPDNDEANVTFGQSAFYPDDVIDVYIYDTEAVIYDARFTFPIKVVIHGFKGSTAQAYAEKYNRTFVDMAEGCEHEIQSKLVISDDKQTAYTKYTCSKCGYNYKGNYTGTVINEDGIYRFIDGKRSVIEDELIEIDGRICRIVNDCIAEIHIDSVSITGPALPVRDEYPDTTATVEDTVYSRIKSVVWSAKDKFKADMQYTVAITVEPVGKGKYTEQTVVYFNGKDTSATLNDDGTLTVKRTYYPTINYSICVLDAETRLPIPGAIVTLGENTVVCDENGIASYILHTGETTTLKIEATDYPKYEVDEYNISMLPCDYIMLELESTGIYEVISRGQNILEQKLQINNKAFTMSVGISVKGRANNQVKILKYEIVQDGKVLAESKTGKFTIKNTKFAVNKDVYAKMYTNGADGHNVFERKINLKVVGFSFKTDIKDLCKKLFDVEMTLPEDAPMIGGLNLKLPYKEGDVNVGVSVQNDKIVVVVGLNFDMKDIEKMTQKLSASEAMKLLTERFLSESQKELEKKESSKKKSVDFEIYGAMAFELRDFNKVVKTYGQLNVKVKFKASCGQTVYAVGIPFRFECAVTASGEVEVQFLSYDWENAEFLMPPTSIKIGLGVDLFGGIGTRLASLGIYGKGTCKVALQIIPSLLLKQVELTGEFGVRVKMKALWFVYSHDYSIWSGKYQLNNIRIMLLKAMYNTDSYSEDTRDYLKDRSEWLGDADESVQQSESTVLQKSSSMDIKPQIVVCGDTRMMLFLDDDGSDGFNYQHLFYSLYDTSKGKWGAPVRVDSSNLADIEFEAFSNGDKIYVTYIKSGEVTDENKADFSEVVSTFEVMVAEYDAAMGKFVKHTNISENDSYDMNPQIAAIDDGIVVVWINNITNDVFAQNANNVIYMRKYVSGKWETVKAVTGYGASITSMDVGRLDGKLYIAAVRDIDCDYSTETDRIVVLIDENGNVTEMKTVNDVNDAVKFVNFNGKEVLIWYNGYNLYKIESVHDVPVFIFENALNGLNPDYKFIQINADEYVLLYTLQEKYTDNDGNDCYGSDIYAVMCRNGVWGKPVTLTRTADDRYVDGFDVMVYNEDLIIPYISTSADFSNDSLFVTSDFMSIRIKSEYDIELSDCGADFDTLFDGDDLGIWYEIRNNSLLQTELVAVKILDSEGNTVYEQNVTCVINAGKSVIEYINIPKDLLKCGGTYTLYVVPFESSDVDLTNNSIQLELWYSRAQVYADTVVVGDKTMLQYALYNRGNINSNGVLKIYKLDGETENILYTYEVEALPVGGCFSGFAEIDDGLYPESGDELIIGVRFESETKELYGTGSEIWVYSEKISRNPLIEVVDPGNTVVPPTIDTPEIIYDKGSANDVIVEITENECTFSRIEGVAKSAYSYEKGLLTINADYLSVLEPDGYNFDIVYSNNGTDVTVSLFIEIIDTTPKEPAVSVDIAGDIYYDGHPIENGIDFILETESNADINTYWSVDGSEWNMGLPTNAGHYYIRIEIAEDIINGYSHKIYEFELEILRNTRAISIPCEVFASENRTVRFNSALPTKGVSDGTILYGYSKTNDASTVKEWLEEGVLPISDTSEIYYIFAKACGGKNYEDAYSVGTAADAHVHEFDDHYSHDINRHWHVCGLCGEKADEAEHTYDNAESRICNVCKAVKYALGDIDGNDEVDSADSEYLLMHTYFPSEYPLNQDCDFNSDGKINSDDAIYLLKHTQQPDEYPLGSENKASESAIPVKRKVYGECAEDVDSDDKY